jgi:hypothetical protein
MYIAGLSTTISYAEGIVTNLMERPESSMWRGKTKRWIAAL